MTRLRGPADGCLVVVGVTHRSAPIELRERLAFEPAAWHAAAPPGVLLVTCNRVEVYGWGAGRGVRLAQQLRRALARAAGVPLETLLPHLVVQTGDEALVHLVRVTAGLDSMVVGENQIRGQVREALALARAHGRVPSTLDGVFRRALEAGRRIRSGSPIGHHPSVAAAGVAVALRTPELADHSGNRPAIVLGAGVMAKSAARALMTAGARVALVNRTPAHAQGLARELAEGVLAGSITVEPLQRLPELLVEAALLVGATASPRPVVDLATVERALGQRAGRPLVVLDLALPRDVDPAVRGLAGVRLIDLDDLERRCPVDVTDRHAEVVRAELQAVAAAEAIATWLRVRSLAPTIAELHRRAEEIRTRELRRTAARLRHLGPEEQAALDALTTAIVKKLLHGPTVAIREAASRPGRGPSPHAVLDLLRLDGRRSVRR